MGILEDSVCGDLGLTAAPALLPRSNADDTDPARDLVAVICDEAALSLLTPADRPVNS